MAKGITVPVVQSGLEASIEAAAKKAGPLNLSATVDPSSFKRLAQPLGRVSGLATEFEKSIAASNARVIAFGASVGIINGVQNAFTALVKTTIEVEKSLTNIAVISGKTTQELQPFSRALFEIAKNTAQSFTTASEAALEFSRQGLGLEETLRRTQDALTLTRFTSLSAAEAVDVLTAAANSFGETGITTSEILNKLVAVDTKFAVSAEDLAKGLSRAGSIAQEVGVNFDELNAIVTIAQERTARGGAVIGNAFKTIFTRIRSDETIKALQSIGIYSFDAEGRLKPVVGLLEELAGKINTLGETKRIEVLEAIASKYNINVLTALVDDLGSTASKFREARDVSAGAQNEAYQRQIELNQTLDAVISRVVTSATQLADTLGKIGVTDSLKSLLNFFDNILTGINDIIDSEGIGGTIAKGLISGLSGVFFKIGIPLLLAIFVKLTKDIAQFGVESLKTILGINKEVRERQALEQAVVNTLIKDQQVMATILSLSGDRRKQEEYLLSVYNRQLAALQQVQTIAAGVAPALQAAGLSATSGTVKRRAAGGYLPNEEAKDVRRGVGGASPSSKVVEIPNFSFGGGKRGTMVANTSEYIVPNYAGGSGTAIFNQDMAKEYGLPPGAKKITASGGFVPASGFVPNFALVKDLSRNPRIQSNLNISAKTDRRLEDNDIINLKGKKFQQETIDLIEGEDSKAYEKRIITEKGFLSGMDLKFKDSAAVDGYKVLGNDISLLEVKSSGWNSVDVLNKFLRAVPENYGENNKLDLWTKNRDNFQVSGLLVSPERKNVNPTQKELFSRKKASRGYIPNFAELNPQGFYAGLVGETAAEGKLDFEQVKKFVTPTEKGVDVRDSGIASADSVTFDVYKVPKKNEPQLKLIRQVLSDTGKNLAADFGRKITGGVLGNNVSEEKLAQTFNPGSLRGFANTIFEASVGALLSDRSFQDYTEQASNSLFDLNIAGNSLIKKNFGIKDSVNALEVKGASTPNLLDSIATKIYQATAGGKQAFTKRGRNYIEAPDRADRRKVATAFYKDGVPFVEKRVGVFAPMREGFDPSAYELLKNPKKDAIYEAGALGYIPNFAGKYFYDPNIITKEDDIVKGEDGKDIKNATLKKVLASRKKINVLIGPVGSGKTSFAQASGGVFLRKPSDVDLADEITVLQTSHTSTKTGGISDNMRQILDVASGQISYLDVSDEIITERRKARSAQAEAGAIVGDTRSPKQIVSGDQFAEKRSPVFVQAVQDYLKTKGKTLNMVKGAGGYIPNFDEKSRLNGLLALINDSRAPQAERDTAKRKYDEILNKRGQKPTVTQLPLTQNDKTLIEKNGQLLNESMGLGFTRDNNLDAIKKKQFNSVRLRKPLGTDLTLSELSRILNAQGGEDLVKDAILKNSALFRNNPTEKKSAAFGYIPNFADNEPLKEAISREIGAGVSPARVRVTQDGRLRNAENPNGLAVINTRDEPNGKIPNDFRERGMRAAMATRGFVPNFADVSRKQLKDLLGKSPNPKNPEIYTGGQDFDYGVQTQKQGDQKQKADDETKKIDIGKFLVLQSAVVGLTSAFQSAAEQGSSAANALEGVSAIASGVATFVAIGKTLSPQLRILAAAATALASAFPLLSRFFEGLKTPAERTAEALAKLGKEAERTGRKLSPEEILATFEQQQQISTQAAKKGEAGKQIQAFLKGSSLDTEEGKSIIFGVLNSLDAINTKGEVNQETLKSLFKDSFGFSRGEGAGGKGDIRYGLDLNKLTQNIKEQVTAKQLTDIKRPKAQESSAKLLAVENQLLQARFDILNSIFESGQRINRAYQDSISQIDSENSALERSKAILTEIDYAKRQSDLEDKKSLAEKTKAEQENLQSLRQSIQSLEDKGLGNIFSGLQQGNFEKLLKDFNPREVNSAKFQQAFKEATTTEANPSGVDFQSILQKDRRTILEAFIAATQKATEITNNYNQSINESTRKFANFRSEADKLDTETKFLNAIIAGTSVQLEGAGEAFSGSQKYAELVNLEAQKVSNSFAKQILANKLAITTAYSRISTQSDLINSESDLLEAELDSYDEEIKNKNVLALKRSTALKLIQSEQKAEEETEASIGTISQKIAADTAAIKRQTRLTNAEENAYTETERKTRLTALVNDELAKLRKQLRQQGEETAVQSDPEVARRRRSFEIGQITGERSKIQSDLDAIGVTTDLTERTVDLAKFTAGLGLARVKAKKTEIELETENAIAIERVRDNYQAEINSTKRKIDLNQALLGQITQAKLNEKVTGDINLEATNLAISYQDAKARLDLLFKDGGEIANEELKIRTSAVGELTSSVARGKALSRLGIGGEMQAQAIAANQAERMAGREAEDVASAELYDIQKNRNQTITQNLREQSGVLLDQAQSFQDIIGKSAPKLFADGMAEAMQAALNQADNLGEALRGVAMSFLKNLQSAFLQSASQQIVASILPSPVAKATGGYVKGYESGGLVTGGSGYKDDVPAMLSAGEYVIRKSSVNKYGRSNLQKLNSGQAPKFAAGGIFLPGVRGQGQISGYKDLTAFANQRTTSGATDIMSSDEGMAFASLEDQSKRLSAYALMNEDDTINQEIRSAQEQAMNIMKEREAYRTAERKAFQKQLIGTVASAALSFGVGKLTGALFGPKAGPSLPLQGLNQGMKDGIAEASASGINSLTSNVFNTLSQNQPTDLSSRLQADRSFNLPKVADSGVRIESPIGQKQNYSLFNSTNKKQFLKGSTPFTMPRGAYGGMVRRFADGGSPTDKVPALLMGGEYIMSNKATKKYGKSFFDSINQGRAPRFADGGSVSTAEPSFAEKAASSSDSKAAGATNVSININVTGGTADTQTQGDTKQGGVDYKKMSEQIKQVVIQTINEEKRLGGSLRPRG